MACFEGLVTENTSTHSDGRALVVLIRPLAELDTLEALGPNGESTGTSRTTEETEESRVSI